MKTLLVTLTILLVGTAAWWHWPEEPTVPEDISALIIGAGAAGLSAAQELEAAGIDYTILEASGTYGGRMKESTDFADFPIDLGAEWIHEDPEVLNDMAGTDVLDEIEITVYNPRELLVAVDGELTDKSDELRDYQEWKFTDSTWFSFFDSYVVPSVEENIIYNQPVSEVIYSDSGVRLETTTGDTYEADYAIVAVPVTILQNEYVTFTPPLPESKTAALNQIEMSPGFKLFIEFSEQFYPEMLLLEEPDPDRPYEEKTFYDATFGKDTSQHVMGILINGEYAKPYLNLTESEIITALLAELDTVYDGQASAAYQDHILQNWSEEPFIQGTYTTNTEGFYLKTLRDARRTVADRVFFAGATYDAEQQGTVPGAWRGGVAAAEAITDLADY